MADNAEQRTSFNERRLILTNNEEKPKWNGTGCHCSSFSVRQGEEERAVLSAGGQVTGTATAEQFGSVW